MDSLYTDQAELDRRKEARRQELEALKASRTGRVSETMSCEAALDSQINLL